MMTRRPIERVSFWRLRSPQLLLALLTLAAAGCGEDPAAARKAATKAKQATDVPKPKGKSAELDKKEPEFAYSPIGKRDPFRPYLIDLGTRGREKGAKKILGTEKYELDQYRLKGVITQTAQPKALVEDPTGKGHVLRLGTPLGKNGGRVTRITSDGIVVTEEFRAPTGQRIRVPMMIDLPKPEIDLLDMQ